MISFNDKLYAKCPKDAYGNPIHPGDSIFCFNDIVKAVGIGTDTIFIMEHGNIEEINSRKVCIVYDSQEDRTV